MKVAVHYNPTLDVRVWREQHGRGLVPDALPYGLDRMRQITVVSPRRPELPPRWSDVLGAVGRRVGGGWNWWPALGETPGDVDVAMAWDERSGIPLALRRNRPPLATGVIWLTDHDQRPSAGVRTAARSALTRASAVWALSSAQLPLLRDEWGVPARRLHRLPFGVDADFWLPSSQAAVEENLVLGVGNDRHRDHRLLVQAVSSLQRVRPVRLELVTRHVVDVPVHLGLRHEVLSAPALRDAYARCAVVAIALKRNVHVSGVTAVLEAMAMGKPVVCTATPGMEDYVQDGVNGFLVPVGDANGLERRVRQLLDDPAAARTMGGLGRAFVLEHASTQRQAERLQEILKECS